MTALLMAIFTVCGKVNFRNLSRYSHLSERTFRRQYEERLDFAPLNGAFLGEAIPSSHVTIGAMDASFLRKSGKQTFGLDYFYNGTHQQVEKGLELSLIAVVDTVTEQAYSLMAQQTVSHEATETEGELTRMDDYIDHLEAARPHFPPQVRYLAVDGYYVKERFILAVLKLKLELISKLRRDANLQYVFTGEQKGRGRRRKYDGKVNLADPSRFTFVTELEPGIDLYTAVVWQVSGGRKIRLAYVHNRQNPAKPTYAVLFSTDLNQDPQEIYRFYRLRFQIEFLFRDAKQFTGLQDCQARDAKKLDFHFNISLMALNIAKSQTQQKHDPDAPFSFSMHDVKQQALNHFLLDSFISNLDLDPTLIKSHPNFPRLLNLGAIHT